MVRALFFSLKAHAFFPFQGEADQVGIYDSESGLCRLFVSLMGVSQNFAFPYPVYQEENFASVGLDIPV
ncbi:MAG: hypothetical protein HOC08_08930 [Deltaproteobacteria bacterium]|nr:hypothetical protein [Deltaproteobacteria bacterium]